MQYKQCYFLCSFSGAFHKLMDAKNVSTVYNEQWVTTSTFTVFGNGQEGSF